MIRAGYNRRSKMFWESKLEELQKLAPVYFASPTRGRWVATFDAHVKDVTSTEYPRLTAEGSTPAGALVELWAKLVHGSTPFTVTVGANPPRRVRFNARWEDVGEDPKPPEPEPAPTTELVVDEPEAAAFDPAD